MVELRRAFLGTAAMLILTITLDVANAEYTCSGGTETGRVTITDETSVDIRGCFFAEPVVITSTNTNSIMSKLTITGSTFMKGFELDFRGTVPNDVMKWEGNQVRGGSVHLHNMKAMGGVRFSGGVVEAAISITETASTLGAVYSWSGMELAGTIRLQNVDVANGATVNVSHVRLYSAGDGIQLHMLSNANAFHLHVGDSDFDDLSGNGLRVMSTTGNVQWFGGSAIFTRTKIVSRGNSIENWYSWRAGSAYRIPISNVPLHIHHCNFTNAVYFGGVNHSVVSSTIGGAFVITEVHSGISNYFRVIHSTVLGGITLSTPLKFVTDSQGSKIRDADPLVAAAIARAERSSDGNDVFLFNSTVDGSLTFSALEDGVPLLIRLDTVNFTNGQGIIFYQMGVRYTHLSLFRCNFSNPTGGLFHYQNSDGSRFWYGGSFTIEDTFVAGPGGINTYWSWKLGSAHITRIVNVTFTMIRSQLALGSVLFGGWNHTMVDSYVRGDIEIRNGGGRQFLFANSRIGNGLRVRYIEHNDDQQEAIRLTQWDFSGSHIGNGVHFSDSRLQFAIISIRNCLFDESGHTLLFHQHRFDDVSVLIANSTFVCTYECLTFRNTDGNYEWWRGSVAIVDSMMNSTAPGYNTIERWWSWKLGGSRSARMYDVPLSILRSTVIGGIRWDPADIVFENCTVHDGGIDFYDGGNSTVRFLNTWIAGEVLIQNMRSFTENVSFTFINTRVENLRIENSNLVKGTLHFDNCSMDSASTALRLHNLQMSDANLTILNSNFSASDLGIAVHTHNGNYYWQGGYFTIFNSTIGGQQSNSVENYFRWSSSGNNFAIVRDVAFTVANTSFAGGIRWQTKRMEFQSVVVAGSVELREQRDTTDILMHRVDCIGSFLIWNPSFEPNSRISLDNFTAASFAIEGGPRADNLTLRVEQGKLNSTGYGGLMFSQTFLVGFVLNITNSHIQSQSGIWYRNTERDWDKGNFSIVNSTIVALDNGMHGIECYWNWKAGGSRYARAASVPLTIMSSNVSGGIRWSADDLVFNRVQVTGSNGVQIRDAPIVSSKVVLRHVLVEKSFHYLSSQLEPYSRILIENVRAASITFQNVPLTNVTFTASDVILDDNSTVRTLGLGFLECYSVRDFDVTLRRIVIRNVTYGFWFRGTNGNRYWNGGRLTMVDVVVVPQVAGTGMAIENYFSAHSGHSHYNIVIGVKLHIARCRLLGSVRFSGDDPEVTDTFISGSFTLTRGTAERLLYFNNLTVGGTGIVLNGFTFGTEESKIPNYLTRIPLTFANCRFPRIHFDGSPELKNVWLLFRRVAVGPIDHSGVVMATGISFENGRLTNVKMMIADVRFNVTTNGVQFMNPSHTWTRGQLALCSVRMVASGPTFLIQGHYNWGSGNRHYPLRDVNVSFTDIHAPSSRIQLRDGADNVTVVNATLDMVHIDRTGGLNTTFVNNTIGYLVLNHASAANFVISGHEGRWIALDFMYAQAGLGPFHLRFLHIILTGGAGGGSGNAALYLYDTPLVQGSSLYFFNTSISNVGGDYGVRFNGNGYGSVTASNVYALGRNFWNGTRAPMVWDSTMRLVNSNVKFSAEAQLLPAVPSLLPRFEGGSCCATAVTALCPTIQCAGQPEAVYPLWNPLEDYETCPEPRTPSLTFTFTSTNTRGATHTADQTSSISHQPTATTNRVSPTSLPVEVLTPTRRRTRTLLPGETAEPSAAPSSVAPIPGYSSYTHSLHENEFVSAPEISRSLGFSRSPIVRDNLESIHATSVDPTDRALSQVIEASTARTVLLSTATGANVATSIVSTTAVTQSGRLHSVLKLLECALDEDDPAPSLLEHPFQPAIGNGNLKRFAGAVLVSSVMTFVVAIVGLVAGYTTPRESPDATGDDKKKRDRFSSKTAFRTIRGGISVSGTIFSAFFIPSIAGSAITIAIHGANIAETIIGVVGLGLCLVAGLSLLYFVTAGFKAAFVSDDAPLSRTSSRGSLKENSSVGDDRSETDRSRSAPNSAASSQRSTPNPEQIKGQFADADPADPHSFMSTLGYYFADAKSDRPAHRLYFWEDVAAASIVGVISGIRPDATDCTTVAIPLVIVSALHLLYVGYFRPYRAKVDNFFAILFAVNNLAMAVLVTVAINNSSLLVAVGWTVTFQLVSFYCQAIVQALHAFYRSKRQLYYRQVQNAEVREANRKSRKALSDDGSRRSTEGGDTYALDVPLLEMPVSTSSAAGDDATTSLQKSNNRGQGLNPLLSF